MEGKSIYFERTQTSFVVVGLCAPMWTFRLFSHHSEAVDVYAHSQLPTFYKLVR